MSLTELLAGLFKVVGQILDLHAKGMLKREDLDALVAQLHEVK